MARSRGVLSRLTFLGERRDVGDILKAADIFCQPNLEREPYGVALVEAMSHGLPVVTTEQGATAVAFGPETGRIVRADAGDLSLALRELIGSPETRRILGEASRVRYVEHLSAEEAIGQLTRALEELTARNRPVAGAMAWA
jgi:glycosyltransferase involved in cell wall biosynthesis